MVQPRINLGHICIFDQQVGQIGEMVTLMFVGDAFDRDDGSKAVG